MSPSDSREQASPLGMRRLRTFSPGRPFPRKKGAGANRQTLSCIHRLNNGRTNARNRPWRATLAEAKWKSPSHAEIEPHCAGRSSDFRAVGVLAFSSYGATMAGESDVTIALGYSGGDRPGLAPDSLFVGPCTSSGRPPTLTIAVLSSNADAASIARREKLSSLAEP